MSAPCGGQGGDGAPAERLDRFMARASAAYYAGRDPFADFVTAPELTQAFGEVLGAWAAAAWDGLGRPDPVLLVELGPGRGTLMADALRVLARVAPGFRRAVRLHLVEASPRLRAEQAARLSGLVAATDGGTGGAPGRGAPDRVAAAGGLPGRATQGSIPGGPGPGAPAPGAPGPDDGVPGGLGQGGIVPGGRAAVDAGPGEAGPVWHDSIDTLPDGAAIVLANEFLDALPVRQLVRRGDAWMERHVLDGRFVERPAAPLGVSAPEGEVVELAQAAQALVASLSARLADMGGCILFVDYGAHGGGGDTLQALRRGRFADPLADPGGADLSVHVDFAAMAGAARAAGAHPWGPLDQGVLLRRLGLDARTEALARARPDQAAQLSAAAERLLSPDAMGRLFQALAITAAPRPPPGFGADERWLPPGQAEVAAGRRAPSGGASGADTLLGPDRTGHAAAAPDAPGPAGARP